MDPATGCPLALARGMKRAIGKLDQLRECSVLSEFGFDAYRTGFGYLLTYIR